MLKADIEIAYGLINFRNVGWQEALPIELEAFFLERKKDLVIEDSPLAHCLPCTRNGKKGRNGSPTPPPHRFRG